MSSRTFDGPSFNLPGQSKTFEGRVVSTESVEQGHPEIPEAVIRAAHERVLRRRCGGVTGYTERRDAAPKVFVVLTCWRYRDAVGG